VKVLKSEKVFESKYLEMIKTKYEKKDGKEADWFHVQRVNMPRIVMIVPIKLDHINTEDSQIIMIKEFRIPLNDYEYGFPAGLVDEGETLEDAIRREMKEETGLDVDEIHSISPAVYNSAGMTNEAVHIAFVSVSGTMSNKGNEASEEIEVLAMTSGQSYELFNTPDIKFGAKAWLVLHAILDNC